jgi:hypothetical protein
MAECKLQIMNAARPTKQILALLAVARQDGTGKKYKNRLVFERP